MAQSPATTIKIRVRALRADDIAFGPGKEQLLESLLGTGSLNRSAAELGMSYVKALDLVRAMNEHFREPLIALTRGGRQGGGAVVTDLGRKVLAEYRTMRLASEHAAQPGWRRLRRLMKS